MTHRSLGLVLVLLAALLLASVATALSTEPCAHHGGKLDTLYCDENRDLVPDPPTTPATIASSRSPT